MSSNTWRFYPYKPRKYPICGQVNDVYGTQWNVREVRTTKHGFDLHFGNPVSEGDYPTGLPRIIATKALIDYWDANRTAIRKVFDLPAGRTTLKRVRQRFHFHVNRDTTKFYEDRRRDLETLSAREFMQKHGVSSYHCLSNWRFKTIGQVSRPLGWWRTPETIKVLLSKLTLKETALKLDIGTSHVHRLRLQAQKDYGQLIPESLPKAA